MGSLLAALGAVFVAELGDKTQLVALGFGAKHRRLAPVLAGIALAYAATTTLSVMVGGALGAALPTRAIGIGAGVLFLGFAAWSLRGDDDHHLDQDEAGEERERGVVLAVAGPMFVAELGDKTMLATATLAAQGNPLLVWIGATIGITLAGTAAVVTGQVIGTRIPESVTRIASAVLFAAFGVVLIVANL